MSVDPANLELTTVDLDPDQKAALDAIYDHRAAHGVSPTYAEIGQAIDLPLMAAYKLVMTLKRKGLVVITPKKHRGITPTNHDVGDPMIAAPPGDGPIHWERVTGPLPVRFAAMALAHSRAYAQALTGVSNAQVHNTLRAVIDRHFQPMYAAFTAAAALNGWDPDRIEKAVEDGATVEEMAWEWLTAAGVPKETIHRLSVEGPDQTP